MRSNTSKILPIVIVVIIILVGGMYYWRSFSKMFPSDIETYSSDQYSFSYPRGFTVSTPTQSFPALTVQKAANKRIEIFQMKDFGDRPLGFEEPQTQEQIDRYVPKERLKVGSARNQYDVWLYYGQTDEKTKKELKAIFDSIEVKN